MSTPPTGTDVPTWPAPSPDTRAAYPSHPVRPARPPAHRLLDALPCTRRRLAMMASFAGLAGLFAYGGYNGIGILVLTLAAAAILLMDKSPTQREVWLWTGAAVAVASLPVFRAALGVTGPAVIVAGACLVMAALVRFTKTGFDMQWLTLLRTPVNAVRGCVESLPWISRKLAATPNAGWTSKLRRVGRAALVAGPLVLIIVALLASADAAFRGLFAIHLDPAFVIVSGFGCVIGFLGIVGLLAQGLASQGTATHEAKPSRLGRFEQLTAMISISCVLAIFISIQLATTYGNTLGLLARSGVSVAQYARSGWFQLLAVVAIDALVVITFRSLGSHTLRRDRPYQSAVTTLVVLSLALLASSLHRLGLYDQAYGWTMLRLACWFAAAWIGFVLVLLLVQAWNVVPSRNWLPGVALLGAVAITLAWGISNPSALVAHHDLARGNIDTYYLLSLGPDATPTMLAGHGDSRDFAAIRKSLCAAPLPTTGVRQFSTSWLIARNALIQNCP